MHDAHPVVARPGCIGHEAHVSPPWVDDTNPARRGSVGGRSLSHVRSGNGSSAITLAPMAFHACSLLGSTAASDVGSPVSRGLLAIAPAPATGFSANVTASSRAVMVVTGTRPSGARRA
jgi:hypothetical protein